MAEQMRPSSPKHAPDPSKSYQRAHPEQEAGKGALGHTPKTPIDRPDQLEQTVTNRQPPRQINAEDLDNPDHSALEDEPLGEDLTPSDVHNLRLQRHPRREGKGGVG
jgi:hypothetical protein